MKTCLAACFSAFAVGMAGATDYVWSGGGTDTGNWKDPANWNVGSGYPVCGDTATFNADATITSDVDMGGVVDTTEVLTITIADGKTLTVNASFSGEGGVTRSGDGTIKLNAANPFKGVYKSLGTLAQTKGRTYITNGGALGLKLADFYVSDYAPLYVNAGGGTLTINVPYYPANNGYNQSTTLYVENGTVILTQPVSPSGRFHPTVAKTGVLKFEGKVSLGGWLDVDVASGAHVWFNGGVRCGSTFYLWPMNGTLHLGSKDNDIPTMTLYGTTVCEVADVFLSNTKMGGFRFGDNSTLDLNGFDQAYPVLTSGQVLSSNVSKFGFTSPVAKAPAYVKLAGDYAKDLSYNGYFRGKAGLEWNPSTDHSFIFTNATSSTAGGLRVKSGTVELAGTSTFTALGDLEVSDGAVLQANAGSCAGFLATNITLEVGAKLRLGDGVTLKTKKLTVGETVYTLPEVYAAADLPDVIEGAGKVEIVGTPCTWTGANGGFWKDAANWSGGAVPDANSAVTIPAGKKVVLDETNAKVFSLTVGGGSSAATLVMTNWTTCLQARNVTIANKGVVTTGAAFETDEGKSRVWIACENLTIDAGGSIDMLAKGWSGGHYKLDGTTNPGGAYYNCDGIASGGWGPGRSRSHNCAAGHFGVGANLVNHGVNALAGVYDDPLAPTEPGSGGHGITTSAYGEAYDLSHGGGAVRIEATGTVVVNGTIDASGKRCVDHSYYHNPSEHAKDANNAGSGGSVYVTCQTIAGVGTIRADGGAGGWSAYCNRYLSKDDGSPVDVASGTGLPGAGGGIAVYYDTAKQTAGACAGMTISAASGLFQFGDILTYGNVDKYRLASEPGTLKFSDLKIVDDTIGRGLSGRLFDVPEYTYDGDLDWTAGWVRFGATGVVVTVTGDLTIDGNARLDVGGNFTETNYAARTFLDAGNVPVKLAVGGDLTVCNGAGLQITAARTGNPDVWGGEVAVAGTFTVGDGGFVYPQSAYGYHGAPHFTAGSFTVTTGGCVNADHRGGSGGTGTASPYGDRNSYIVRNDGVGLGGGITCAGGSYGGLGGKSVSGTEAVSSAKPGKVYGDLYRPIYPGSGGSANGYGEGGDGGGLFHLVAAGPVVVDGTITANGWWTAYFSDNYQQHFGSGSGGAIYLSGTTFSGAATAVLSARGGDSWLGNATHAAGCGGGGRIALWFGADKEAAGRHSERHALVRTDAALQGGFDSWHGTTDVTGGRTRVVKTSTASVDPVEIACGADGTVSYSGAFDPFGLLLILK